MKKASAKLRPRMHNRRAQNEVEISAQELRLLRKLKSSSRPTFEALVHVIYHLVELPPPIRPKISKKDYLNDPLWKLVGKAASGRKNDDSAIEHDRYLYGGEA
ncbi:hypothetical protein HUU05_06180 [candidate division KSB1 bacterium]|nr:hypothetical protein [candidate division KSB1 bacterium]